MKTSFALLIMLLSLSASAQIDSAYYYYKLARSVKDENNAAFYKDIMKAHSFHPYHPGMLYEAAIASARTGKDAQAIELLNNVVLLKADVNLDDNEFKILTANPKYSDLRVLQKKLLQTIVTSDTAFIIPDRSLHIECIAKGEKSNIFYFGCIHKRKIIKRDANGKISDFTNSAQDGLTSVLGIKVDTKKNVLWACSSPMREMENFDSLAKSAVFKYDLQSKKLIKKYEIANDHDEHVFGDLTLDPKGNAFISDSKTNIIYQIDEMLGTIVPYFSNSEFWNLQGISFDASGKNLFIADYIKGLYRLNIQTKELKKISVKFDLSLKSVDGLTFYNNSLIALQNYIFPMRVTRYFLSADQNSLDRFSIIDSNHPAFGEPTIGCIDGDNFYYVANSFWSGYDDNGNLKSADQLPEVIILKAKMKN